MMNKHGGEPVPGKRLEVPITFTDSMTLGEARDALRKLVNEGHRCPCCTQFAKVYKRKLNSGMAVSLIRMWKTAGLDWQHVPTTIGGKSREEGKLRYWGLVEEETTLREDGGRAGYWRVTPRGRDFIHTVIVVEKYALVYDGRCLGLIDGPIGIRACLGSKFDYAELMRGERS